MPLSAPSTPSLQAVRITTTGSSFNPTVELASGSTATVTWTCEETGLVETGINPTLTFGSSATRHVRMTVKDTYGDAIKDVITFNMGYNSGDDAGTYVMGAGYNKSAQSISGIENIRAMTGLIRFAAANISTLVGTLDFTGLSQLQYIECYQSRVQNVILSGCTSLIRLCMEANNLTTLDINPVAANLKDLRAAAQSSGSITFVRVSTDLGQLYHYCTRSNNPLVGFPAAERFAVIKELWIWDSGLTGAFSLSSSIADSIIASGNDFTSISISNATGLVNFSGNAIESVTLTDCVFASMDLSNNPLVESVIDAILAEADSWSTSNGTIVLTGTWGVRSAAGVTSRGNLVGRGWTVTYDGPGVTSDNFTRADATGVANIGNDWYAWNSANANIASNKLVRTDSGAYRQLLNHGGGALAADYSVSFVIPAGTVLGNCGFTIRWDGRNGVRLWFNNATDITIGDASGFNTNNVSISAPSFPASWSNSGIDRTLTIHASGTTITLEIDAEPSVTTATVTTNATKTGTSFGYCGQGQNFVYGTVTATTP